MPASIVVIVCVLLVFAIACGPELRDWRRRRRADRAMTPAERRLQRELARAAVRNEHFDPGPAFDLELARAKRTHDRIRRERRR